MRQTQLVKQNIKGFTLIEVLMAVLLIAILATIAITQFTNFARDTRNAAVKENLGILRNAIQKHYGTMRLRCDVTNTDFPPLTAVNGNDIAVAGGPCDAVPSGTIPETDRYFAAGGIPENPWSDGTTCTNKRQVIAAPDPATMDPGVNYADTLTNCGWIYDATTGKIKANSNLNGGDGDGLNESGY